MTIAELFPARFLRIIGITKRKQYDKFQDILHKIYQEMTENQEEDQYDDDTTVANAFAMIITLTSQDGRQSAEMWDEITKKENLDFIN